MWIVPRESVGGEFAGRVMPLAPAQFDAAAGAVFVNVQLADFSVALPYASRMMRPFDDESVLDDAPPEHERVSV